MNQVDKITYHLLSILSRILSKLSLNDQVKISQHLASIFYHYIPKRKNLALKNLSNAFPNHPAEWIEKTLKNCYKFLTFNFIQFLTFPQSTKNVKIQVIGQGLLDEALNKGLGVILISAHFGTWEILGHWFGINNYPLRGVAQRQTNKGANKFFEEKRQLSGIKHIYRKVSFDRLYNILKKIKYLDLSVIRMLKVKGFLLIFLINQHRHIRGRLNSI